MGERNIGWLPLTPPSQLGTKPAHNTGMCPERESNQRPLGLRDDAQPPAPLGPGLQLFLTHYLLFFHFV